MKDYQKAMLYVYPRIGKIIRDIDGMVEAQAFCCFGTESCEKTAERIAGYICAKSSFVILKDALENILSRLTKDERYMLEYKYFRRRSKLEGEFCGYALDCNERTYFRRQARLSEKLERLVSARRHGRGVVYGKFFPRGIHDERERELARPRFDDGQAQRKRACLHERPRKSAGGMISNFRFRRKRDRAAFSPSFAGGRENRPRRRRTRRACR